MRLTSHLLALALSIGAAFMAPLPVMAQSNAFSPIIKVNDASVTGYEMEQRIRFLELLRFPGDIPAEAEKGLIEDRLRLEAAKQGGVKIGKAQLEAGMSEFAGRANLTTEQFLGAIAQGGVDPQTFRDFVEAGLAWREVARGKFGQNVTISDAEIDRALSADNNRGAGPRVLISEILLRARAGEVGRARLLAQKIKDQVSSESSFAEAAKLYSTALSRTNGGKVDWIPVTNLPPQVRAAISQLGQGQVSDPVPLPGAVGLFMIRNMQEGADKVQPGAVVFDYAQLLIPNGPDAAAEAQRIRGEVDTCDDLYRVANGLPADQLIRSQGKRGQIPADILRELDVLDANDVSTNLRSGNAVVVLMLCSRNATLADGYVKPEMPTAPGALVPAPNAIPGAGPTPPILDGVGLGYGPSRDAIREELISRKVAQLADGYMAELKANAIITRP
jgi:peptidyl-prolyl cis-trans isomerase SurA